MKQKIFFTIAILSLLSLAVFVTAIEGNTWATETDANFFEGWNLVYGFIHPNQLEGQFLEASHIKAVYAFNPKTQEYARVYPNPEENKLSSITEDELSQTALFVYSDTSAQTEYWLDSIPKSLDQRQMYTGWNFVGVTSDMLGSGGKPELKDLAGTCNIQKTYFFNPEQQNWNTFPMDEDFSSDALNMGILIKVSNDCKMGNSGSSVTPPQIPNGETSQGECENSGGKWQLAVEVYPEEYFCNMPTSDAGEECSDQSQCEGSCMASLTDQQYEQLGRGETIYTNGSCSEYKTAGLGNKYQPVFNGQINGIMVN